MSTRPTDTIFQEGWWLDAVAPSMWSAHELRENGELLGWMPLVERQAPLGLNCFGMPPLTQTLGPWIKPSSGSQQRQVARFHQRTSTLLETLPRFDFFSQSAWYGIEDTLPFHWAGFDVEVRYTYVLDALTNLDAVWDNLSSRTRGSIRKAENKLKVTTLEDIEPFIELYTGTFSRQMMDAPVDQSVIERVFRAGCDQKAVKLLVAKDDLGRIHGAVFLLYDERATYYLMGGSDPSLRESQSLSLLLWHAIQFAATVSARFDFEGSMIPNIERFFRNFGAEKRLYYALSKKSPRFEILWTLRKTLRTLRPRMHPFSR